MTISTCKELRRTYRSHTIRRMERCCPRGIRIFRRLPSISRRRISTFLCDKYQIRIEPQRRGFEGHKHRRSAATAGSSPTHQITGYARQTHTQAEQCSVLVSFAEAPVHPKIETHNGEGFPKVLRRFPLTLCCGIRNIFSKISGVIENVPSVVERISVGLSLRRVCAPGFSDSMSQSSEAIMPKDL
jgi:hypothetical protein